MYPRFLLTSFILGLSVYAFGQKDSIHGQIRSYISNAKALHYKDNLSGYDYIKKAYDLSAGIYKNNPGPSNTKYLLESGVLLSEYLIDLDKEDEAMVLLYYFIEVIGNDVEYEKELTQSMNLIAFCYQFKGMFDSALSYYFNVLEFDIKNNDEKMQAIMYHNIGGIYLDLKDGKDAIKYFELSMQMDRKTGTTKDWDISEFYLGHAYHLIGKDSMALKAYDRASISCGNNCEAYKLFEIEYGRASVYKSLKCYSLAVSHINNSYNHALKSGSQKNIANSLVLKAAIEVHTQAFDSASVHLNKALSILQKGSYKTYVVDVYKGYSDYYDAIQDYQNANKYMNLYNSLHDSLANTNKVNAMANIKAAHDLKRKDSTLNSMFILTSIIFVTFIVIGVVIYIYSHKSRSNENAPTLLF